MGPHESRVLHDPRGMNRAELEMGSQSINKAVWWLPTQEKVSEMAGLTNNMPKYHP